ncbi:MAG: hypothetical protein IJG06_00060 [Clostridia bacterium]|nr:hypothetical protein [Clostridia bacterium]
MTKDKPDNPIKKKIPMFTALSDITLTMEIGGTQYRFRGIYDGERALSAKLLRLMENENEFEKGADKTNDER